VLKSAKIQNWDSWMFSSSAWNFWSIEYHNASFWNFQLLHTSRPQLSYASQKLNSLDSSGSLYWKNILPKFFDRKANWSKHHLTDYRLTGCHLTESPFNRRSFDRKFILPKKIIWPKTKFIKRLFDQKYLENGHLTEKLTWKTS
jgi:hypothetical protein